MRNSNKLCNVDKEKILGADVHHFKIHGFCHIAERCQLDQDGRMWEANTSSDTSPFYIFADFRQHKLAWY